MTTPDSNGPGRSDTTVGAAFVRVALAKIVGLVASFAGAIVVSRALGPSQRGVFSLATTVAATASFLFTLGIPAALTWQIGQGRRPIRLSRKIMYLSAGPATAVLIALYCAKAFGNSAYAQLPVLLTIAMTGVVSAGLVVRAVLAGMRAYSLLARVGTTFAILTALLSSAASLVTQNATYSLGAALAAAMLAYGYYLRPTRRLWRRDLEREPTTTATNWSYALLSWITNLVGEVTLRFDLLLLGFLRSPEEVGIYAAAVGLAQALWIIPSAGGEVAFAETTRSGASGHERFMRLTGPYMWGITGTTFLAAVILYPLAPHVIPFVLGQEYEPAVRPLQLLLPGVVGYSLANIGGNALAGRGRVGRNLAVSGMIALLTVVGDFWFIPAGGAAAAAMVSSVAYLLSTGMVIFFVQRMRRSTGETEPAD